MMVRIRNICEEKNNVLNTKVALPRELPPFVIAIMVLKKFNFVVIMPDNSKNRESGFLAFYDGNTESPSYGLYVTDSDRMNDIFSYFHGDLKQRDIGDIIRHIRAQAPTRRVDTTQDIVPLPTVSTTMTPGNLSPIARNRPTCLNSQQSGTLMPRCRLSTRLIAPNGDQMNG